MGKDEKKPFINTPPYLSGVFIYLSDVICLDNLEVDETIDNK